MDFERILKTHYFLFKSFSSLCAPPTFIPSYLPTALHRENCWVQLMPSASLVESDPKNFGQIAILTEFKKLFSFLDEGSVLQLLGYFLNDKSRPILHLDNSNFPPIFWISKHSG